MLDKYNKIFCYSKTFQTEIPNYEPNVFKEILNTGKNYEEYLEEDRKRKLKLIKKRA